MRFASLQKESMRLQKTPGCLIITHYQRLLDLVKPDVVHVLIDGKIVESGGPELALKLEKEGYDWVDALV